MNGLKKILSSRILIFIGCFIVSTIIYWNVSSLYTNENIYSTSSNEAVYVMEDIEIDFRYDTTKYEVVPFVNKPYVVIKGDKATINKMKWSKEEPYFYIDLTGKLPGTYQEVIYYDNIPTNLTVEIYPLIVDLRIMEQQTISFVPQIELKGVDNLGDNYIVSVPELETTEIKVKGMQETLNKIGAIKGVVDISDHKKSFEADVVLEVYDREGNKMPEVNLIEPKVRVMIPISKKVTIVNEQVINEIVIIDEDKDTDTQTGKPIKEPTQGTPVKPETPSKPNVEPKPETPKPNDTVTQPKTEAPKQEGVLSFVNIPKTFKIENLTPKLTWSSNVKIDLKGFEEGSYEMTIKDNGKSKILKFRLYTDEPKDEPQEGVDPTEPDNGEVDHSNPSTDANKLESKQEHKDGE